MSFGTARECVRTPRRRHRTSRPLGPVLGAGLPEQRALWSLGLGGTHATPNRPLGAESTSPQAWPLDLGGPAPPRPPGAPRLLGQEGPGATSPARVLSLRLEGRPHVSAEAFPAGPGQIADAWGCGQTIKSRLSLATGLKPQWWLTDARPLSQPQHTGSPGHGPHTELGERLPGPGACQAPCASSDS